MTTHASTTQACRTCHRPIRTGVVCRFCPIDPSWSRAPKVGGIQLLRAQRGGCSTIIRTPTLAGIWRWLSLRAVRRTGTKRWIERDGEPATIAGKR